jgi:hypothetical protein
MDRQICYPEVFADWSPIPDVANQLFRLGTITNQTFTQPLSKKQSLQLATIPASLNVQNVLKSTLFAGLVLLRDNQHAEAVHCRRRVSQARRHLCRRCNLDKAQCPGPAPGQGQDGEPLCFLCRIKVGVCRRIVIHSAKFMSVGSRAICVCCLEARDSGIVWQASESADGTQSQVDTVASLGQSLGDQQFVRMTPNGTVGKLPPCCDQLPLPHS